MLLTKENQRPRFQQLRVQNSGWWKCRSNNEGISKKKFALIKSITTANKFTKEFYSKFKNNEIKGQKSFDGNFYVIDVYLYNNIRKQILSSGLDKNFSIEDLSKKLNKEIDLLKIAIEFLKEEGVIIEKRKNIYCLV